MKIQTILDQIDLGSIALPEFQRGYVWNRNQVKGLMDSLYRRHPVGSLLVWETRTEQAHARGDGRLASGTIRLLLDGQQRITSLYGIIRGEPPRFFDGNKSAFTGLHFHLDDELFEFYAPLKMKDNPLWISVTELMQEGIGVFIQQINDNPDLRGNLNTYITRINAIDQVKDIELHIEAVTGADKTVDVVVDIFNKVNSGGTKLSKGDLALAKVCASWPEARDEMKARLDKWHRAGFNFKLDWLMRCITTTVTGEAYFEALEEVNTAKFREGLDRAERGVDYMLNLIGSRLGLDHDRVLGSRYSFPIVARYLDQRGMQLADHRERDRLLYWYVHTFLWGRYAGSTESALSQDLNNIKEHEGALDHIIEQLRRGRGDLRLRPNDFVGWSRGARFYPLLYMLTRVWHAKDWGTGIELSSHLLGHLSNLQLHHIFPRAMLYRHDYEVAEVNALANFTFLTQETNLHISDRAPEEYFEEITAKLPGVLESHWIPMDRDLWKVDRYKDFLATRRELLAQAANDFLDSLLAGTVPEREVETPVVEREHVAVPGTIASKEEEQLLLDTNMWVVEQGLPEGEFVYEVVDEATGEPLVVLDLAWPNGLQAGLSQPVALLIDEGRKTEEAANRAGYRYFTDIVSFREYVLREILAIDEVVA